MSLKEAVGNPIVWIVLFHIVRRPFILGLYLILQTYFFLHQVLGEFEQLDFDTK